MKRTYVKPLQRVADIAAEQLICESNVMGYSDTDFAQHGLQEEVLVRRESLWEDLW